MSPVPPTPSSPTCISITAPEAMQHVKQSNIPGTGSFLALVQLTKPNDLYLIAPENNQMFISLQTPQTVAKCDFLCPLTPQMNLYHTRLCVFAFTVFHFYSTKIIGVFFYIYQVYVFGLASLYFPLQFSCFFLDVVEM